MEDGFGIGDDISCAAFQVFKMGDTAVLADCQMEVFVAKNHHVFTSCFDSLPGAFSGNANRRQMRFRYSVPPAENTSASNENEVGISLGSRRQKSFLPGTVWRKKDKKEPETLLFPVPDCRKTQFSR